ncbi:alpha/beta fold hydrolase [Streptomyces sp. NBC_01264]|uniref:alpha/beta fold hydrolase n=1 Tax=Streptomyces sp. NBC_01264 TaxID=2903804 RepID=UPI0022571D72|nr:alpha/beta fold hydrolase [Streptomyces sp. NBC_01264]MCX4782311.1 alpha/beta fold hydrolase [Streptomyces sp. NBC_01264]
MTTELIPVADGGRIWAERAGDGPPLVLLHGSVHDSRLWDRVFATLARHRTVVRYDARGHGRSTPPTGPFRYEDDLLAVLDRFDFRTAGLVGLSMGGEVALDFALEHPERVRSLTLIAASAGGHEWPRSPETDAYAAARRGSVGRRTAELELALWASLGDRAPGFEVIEPMVRENAEAGAAAEKGHALDPAEDAVGGLDRIGVPTVVAVGDHDHPEIRVIADRLADGIPGARLEVVVGADHYLPLRAPGRLLELLLRIPQTSLSEGILTS